MRKIILFDLDGTLVRFTPQFGCIADINQLHALKRDYDFALVSGGLKREVLAALDKANLRQFFDDAHIVTFEDTGQEKSTGEPFREIQRRMQRDMVMIGDSESDAEGTKRVGMFFVKVATHKDLRKQQAELSMAIQKAIKLL